MTNYEKIKAMSVEEMAKYLSENFCHGVGYDLILACLLEEKKGMKLKPCKCGGEVRVAFACGEYFIVCENNCMDIPACFHSSEEATAAEWNKWEAEE